MDGSVPVADVAVRTPQPGVQLVKEDTAVGSSKKVCQEVLGMAAAALDVGRLQDGDDVFEEDFGIVRPTPVMPSWLSPVWIEKFKDLQLAPDPLPGSRQENVVVSKALRLDLVVLGYLVDADV